MVRIVLSAKLHNRACSQSQSGKMSWSMDIQPSTSVLQTTSSGVHSVPEGYLKLKKMLEHDSAIAESYTN